MERRTTSKGDYRDFPENLAFTRYRVPDEFTGWYYAEWSTGQHITGRYTSSNDYRSARNTTKYKMWQKRVRNYLEYEDLLAMNTYPYHTFTPNELE